MCWVLCKGNSENTEFDKRSVLFEKRLFCGFHTCDFCNTERNTNPFIFTAHSEAGRCPGLSDNCIGVIHFELHNKKLIASITGSFKILRHVFNFQPGKYLPVLMEYYKTVERVYINAGIVFWFHSLLLFF